MDDRIIENLDKIPELLIKHFGLEYFKNHLTKIEWEQMHILCANSTVA